MKYLKHKKKILRDTIIELNRMEQIFKHEILFEEKDPNKVRAALDWCEEQWGDPETNNRWFLEKIYPLTEKDYIMAEEIFYCFYFQDEIDAMAFKLRWVE